MEKRNNKFLKGYFTYFASLGGMTAKAGLWWNAGKCYAEFAKIDDVPVRCSVLLQMVFSHAATFPARVIVQGTLEEMSRDWFSAGAYGTGWRLVSYSHENRTGVYENDEGCGIAVTRAANWVDASNVLDMIEAYTQAESGFISMFGFPFLGSPTVSGLYALEQTLPPKVPCPALPDDFAELLHQYTTQGRSEQYLPNEFKSFYVNDRRFAYAADCRLEMPCGLPRHELRGDFVPYDPAFYRIRFTVPQSWLHVGLLPVLCPGI